MSVTIGFTIGENPTVNITEEHGGLKQTTRFNPEEFLEKSGLSMFYDLKPALAQLTRKRTQRRKAGQAERAS